MYSKLITLAYHNIIFLVPGSGGSNGNSQLLVKVWKIVEERYQIGRSKPTFYLKK